MEVLSILAVVLLILTIVSYLFRKKVPGQSTESELVSSVLQYALMYLFIFYLPIIPKINREGYVNVVLTTTFALIAFHELIVPELKVIFV